MDQLEQKAITGSTPMNTLNVKAGPVAPGVWPPSPLLPMAPGLKNIIAALCAFQASLVPPKKDTANPFFKSMYADLASVWEACRPLMAANGLALVQMPTTNGNIVAVTGTLYHISGESITSTLFGNAKDALPQSIGSAITYLRRYQMCSMLGVAAEDDDGNAASQGKPEKAKSAAQIKGPFSHGISQEQFNAEQAAIATSKAAEAADKSQADLGSFRAYIKSGKVGKVGPQDPKTKAPQWTLYVIDLVDRDSMVTFSKEVYAAAGRAVKEDAYVKVCCEPGKNGPTIVAIEFDEPGDGDNVESQG